MTSFLYRRPRPCRAKTVLLPAALLALSFGGPCSAAITIAIAGEAASTSATVTLSGSFTLADAEGDFAGSNLRIPYGETFSGAWGTLGDSPLLAWAGGGILTTQADPGANIGPLADSASFTITDTSAGGMTIATGSIINMTYDSPETYQLVLAGPVTFPESVDAGDVLTLSGSFDLSFASGTFASHFEPGSNTGFYDTLPQQFSSFTVTQIPEPSSAGLASLALVAALRRRRTNQMGVQE